MEIFERPQTVFEDENSEKSFHGTYISTYFYLFTSNLILKLCPQVPR